MSRINTNVSSLIAQRIVGKQSHELNLSLERLSTGLKINKGADDPAGLIASENLRAEKAGIAQAIDNAERASNIIGTAEGGLSEISSLLTELQSLVTQAANSGGLSQEEVDANQLQVDSILGTINRIANTTAFQGTKLLNGNYAYSTSGVANSAFASIQINNARLADGQATNVVVQVTNSATRGKVVFDNGADATIQSAVTLTIAGVDGAEQLSFQSGTTISAIAAAVNSITDVTGVTASANLTTFELAFSSSGFGSSKFVSVTADKDFFSVTGGTNGKDYGSDAVVSINGAAAEADGKYITYRSSDLDLEFELADSANIDGASKLFAITGGGATFALASKVTEGGKANIGIQAVSSGSLGDGVVGYLSDLGSGKDKSLNSGNLVAAQRVLDKAIKQVSQLRGRLGAFQKFTIGSTVNSLGVAYENAAAAESAIRDTDFAEETSKLTRSQILSQAATTVLAQANASPQAALSLLR
jgi:flagellin